jgi:glycosyltransferase involved in cell wall biosynthesis
MFGGPHNQVLRLHSALGKAGIRITVLLPREPGDGTRRLLNHGVDVITAPLHRIRLGQILPNVSLAAGFGRQVRHVRKLVRDRGIELVQVAGLVTLQPVVAARMAGVPLVWQLVDRGGPALIRALAASFVRRWADAIMVAGRTLGTSYFGPSGARQPYLVYYPPVDTDRFARAPDARMETRARLHIPQHALVVGTVANITPSKGLEYFIQAASEIHHAVDNCWFLVVGGNSPTQQMYRQGIDRLASRAGLPSGRFIFAGPRDDVERYYPAMDVSLLTSVSEGAPTTVLEAMACGVPVVATDVGAVREMVQEGLTGLIVQPRDACALATASVRLLQDQSTRREMGEHARRRAVELYGVEACVQTYLAAYRLAASSASPKVGARGIPAA